MKILDWLEKKVKSLGKAPSCPPGEPAGVSEAPVLYWSLMACGITIVVILAIAAWATRGVFLYKGIITFKGGATFSALLAIYVSLSLKVVGVDELGGAFFYGKALVRLSAGPHFIPWGFMQVGKVSRLVQEFQCPGEPEVVFKGDDRDPLPQGMVRPIRAVSRAPKDDEKKILDTQMTLVLSFVVQLAVTDVFDFMANFGSFKLVQKQLRDIGEVTIVETVSQNTPAEYIENLPDTNKKLITVAQDRFEHSGIKIISVRLISPDLSHDVSKALAGIPEERAKAEQVKVRSLARKVELTNEGAGKAAAELALLTAQAKGRKEIMDKLAVTGDAVLASEAVRNLSDKTDVLVVGAESGMKDVMGLVKGAQSALAAGKGGAA